MVTNLPVPYVPKNFTLPPNFQLIGQPYGPTGFSTAGGPYVPGGTNLVPTRGGLPAAIDALGPSSALPEAVTAGEPAAAAGSRLLGILGPLMALAGAAYADPGNTSGMTDRAGKENSFVDALGSQYLNDQPGDVGATKIAKSVGRGAIHVKDSVSDLGKSLWGPHGIGYLWSDENDTKKYDEANTPTQPVDLTVGPETIHESGGGPSEWVIPQGGEDRAGFNNSLDSLMALLGAEKPQKMELPEDLKKNLQQAAFWDSFDTSLPTNMNLLSRIAGGQTKANIKAELQGLELDAANQKNLTGWLDNYAKTGVDVAKAKHEISKDDFKIHSTKNGFLLEMTDKNGDKVLRPISSGVFGADPNAKVAVGDTKFAANNPLKTELGLLQNLQSVGILNDVLVENAKALRDATKGMTDEKQIHEAQVLTLARALHQSPQFKAQLIEKYTAAMGATPQGGQAESPDWLTELDNARGQ